MDGIEHEINQLAKTWSTVLFCGEFGTEKERIARLIHQRSDRGGPFVTTSLAAMNDEEMSRHLLGDPTEGYGDGGSFGRADEGTLFIDDIDRAPSDLQDTIVTLLKTGTLPGPEGPRLSNTRLLAGTAADASIVRDGKHVPSLLHSLGNVLSVPPLRERREDIARLFLGFVREALAHAGREEALRFRGWRIEPWLPRGFMARLTLYRWPGNTEQLRNVADQLVADSLGRPRAHITPTLERMF